MGILGLLGLILVIIGVWQLVVHAILFGIILIIVGLVIAGWGGRGGAYW